MFLEIMEFYCRNFKEVTTVGVIMVSAMIVLIGCLKPFIFDKIPNKDVRGVLLSLSNIVGAFATVAITFLIRNVSFENYWIVSTAFCICSVFVYWLYENTRARAGIHKLGKYVLTKVGRYITNKVDDLAFGTKEVVSFVSSAVKADEKSVVTLKPTVKKDELDELK